MAENLETVENTEEELSEDLELINDVFVVDTIKREIIVPDTEDFFGVYSDKDVERKYFKCPKMVGDNVDLSTCLIFINYVSVGKKAGQYMCTDMAVDETGNYITFSWLLSGGLFDENETGTVYFAIQAKKLNEDGTYSNAFNTKKAKGTVYETVASGDQMEELYADVMLQILATLNEKITFPKENGVIQYGESGQILQTNGDGSAMWTDHKSNGGKVLWKGFFNAGTIEFSVPQECFHCILANGSPNTLTLLIEGYQYTESTDYSGDYTALVSLSLEAADTDGIYAPANSTYGSSMYLKGELTSDLANGMRIYLEKVATTDYAICRIMSDTFHKVAVTCISAYIPDEEV